MLKLSRLLPLLLLLLLSPSRSHAQAVIVGQPCGAGGLSAIATNGQAVVCQGSPLLWTIAGGSSDPQGGGTSTALASNCSIGYVTKQGDFIIQNDTGNVNGATFTLTYRMILATGERREFQQTGLVGAASNGPGYNGFPLPEGCLVGGSLTLLGGSVDSGQTYAQVFLGRNNSPIPNASSIQLLGCQLSSNYSCGWPGTWRAPTDGQGFNQTITIANPPSGGGLTNAALSGGTIIGQKHWLANIRTVLTTSATAGARQVCMALADASANVVYKDCIQGTQAASLTVGYDWAAGTAATFSGAATLTVIPSTNVAATANEVHGVLPSNFQFSDAMTLTITVIGVQTGDQLSLDVVRTFWSHHATD